MEQGLTKREGYVGERSDDLVLSAGFTLAAQRIEHRILIGIE